MSAASSAVCRPPVCWWMFPCQITSTSVSTPAHYNGSQTVPGAVCGQSGREQVVRSEGHWREGYCVSHPAVSSDHTLSRPGSASVCVSVCVPACMRLLYLEDVHPAASLLNQWIICWGITPVTRLTLLEFRFVAMGALCTVFPVEWVYFGKAVGHCCASSHRLKVQFTLNEPVYIHS